MGSFGTHTIRISNNSNPAECSTQGFSQTACGFVIEFADIIVLREMNSTILGNGNGSGNIGGWEYSLIRSFVNSSVYNQIPETLRNAIINTYVVSSHGSNDSSNFTTTDKLYLLSSHEVYEETATSNGIDYYDSAYYNTRQLDYYKNNNVTTSSNYDKAIKKLNGVNEVWWLRSSVIHVKDIFLAVGSNGGRYSNGAPFEYGVSPAFRIG